MDKLLVFALIIVLFSCQTKIMPNLTEYYSKHYPSEKRDSLYVLYTLKRWSISDFWIYGIRLDMYKYKEDDVSHFLGGAFYSPNKLKSIFWIGTKSYNAPTIEKYNDNPEVNKLCPNCKDTIYNMSALIGIRERIDESWNLYPFDEQSVTCASNKEEARDVLIGYYFFYMKDDAAYRLIQNGKMKGKQVSTKYGYNIQDKGFWDKCWIWEKDNIVSKGLYPFQMEDYDVGTALNKNNTDCHQCVEAIKTPEIVYPDSILRLYNTK